MDKRPTLRIIFDGDCPFCSKYVQHTRLRREFGRLELVNARQSPDVVAEFRGRGLDVNQGMILDVGGIYYHGSDCLNRLALMSSRSGFFNKVTATIFRHQYLSSFSYPMLKFGRNLVLWLQRMPKL